MINSAVQLRSELLSSGIAEEKDLEGASPSEIERLEAGWGKLPLSYCDMLTLVGRRAGRLVDDSEFQFYVDQLDVLNERIHRCRAEATEEGDSVAELPDSVFFISSRYLQNPCFVIAEPREDSEVYLYGDEEETVELLHSSVWGWVEEFVRDAKELVALGAKFRHARLG